MGDAAHKRVMWQKELETIKANIEAGAEEVQQTTTLASKHHPISSKFDFVKKDCEKDMKCAFQL